MKVHLQFKMKVDARAEMFSAKQRSLYVAN